MISKFYDKVAGHSIIQSYRTLQTFTASQLSHKEPYTFSRLSREIRAELITRGFVNLKQILPSPLKNDTTVRIFSPDTAVSIQASVSAASEARGFVCDRPTFKGRAYWNCFGFHKGENCPSPHCRNCMTVFKSVHDSNYHLFSTCSERQSFNNKRKTSNMALADEDSDEYYSEFYL